MTYLLDTHTFIWWAVDPEKLPDGVLQVMESPDNRVFLSIVSLWEMQIKSQLNKLELPLPLEELVSQQCVDNHIELLTIEPPHIYMLEKLPLHHRDPFDRLLIAQSLVTGCTFISRDSEFEKYTIECLW